MSANHERQPDLSREEVLGLLQSLPHGIAVVDAGGTLSCVTEGCAQLHNWPSSADLEGRSWRELFEADDADRLENVGLAAARSGSPWRGEATGRRHDGLTFPQETLFSPLARGRVALVIRDLTEGKQAEERVKELVYRDALTGLPNRRLFDDRLAVALAHAHRYRHRIAVILVDLDRFKGVNETLGHAAGDELLRAVAERLTSSVRGADTVARIAGDEFTLLLPGLNYAEDVGTVTRKLLDALRRPFTIEGQDVRVTASGGVALYPEDGETRETLLKRADTAMYRAKEQGRDNVQLFSPAMAEKALERRALAEGLRLAIENEEMTLHYQPCLDLATGRVLGVEALLRWERPELGLVMPRDFIALADFSGVILSVGPWVLETACRQVAQWRRRGSPGLHVMVNLSAYELQQPELISHVELALASTGLDPDALHLEIPEGYAMQDLDRAEEVLRELRALGVHLAIDGFGAGFSSLAHLRRLPVDTLKIDLSFVRGATSDPNDASVVTAVIAVAHSLDLRVAAQGVETEAQVTLLRSLGCDEVQGFLWSPPVPAEECEPLLAAGALLEPPLEGASPGRDGGRRRKRRKG